jgi:hypothetical protein
VRCEGRKKQIHMKIWSKIPSPPKNSKMVSTCALLVDKIGYTTVVRSGVVEDVISIATLHHTRRGVSMKHDVETNKSRSVDVDPSVSYSTPPRTLHATLLLLLHSVAYGLWYDVCKRLVKHTQVLTLFCFVTTTTKPVSPPPFFLLSPPLFSHFKQELNADGLLGKLFDVNAVSFHST